MPSLLQLADAVLRVASNVFTCLLMFVKNYGRRLVL